MNAQLGTITLYKLNIFACGCKDIELNTENSEKEGTTRSVSTSTDLIIEKKHEAKKNIRSKKARKKKQPTVGIQDNKMFDNKHG